LPKELQLFFKIIDAKKKAEERDKYQNQIYGNDIRGKVYSRVNNQNSESFVADERRRNAYQVQVQPSRSIRNQRENSLNSKPRFRSIRNNPSAVIDHRNNAWRDEHLPLALSDGEEDKVEEMKQGQMPRQIAMRESKKAQTMTENHQVTNRRRYQTNEMDAIDLNLDNQMNNFQPMMVQDIVNQRNNIQMHMAEEQDRLIYDPS